MVSPMPIYGSSHGQTFTVSNSNTTITFTQVYVVLPQNFPTIQHLNTYTLGFFCEHMQIIESLTATKTNLASGQPTTLYMHATLKSKEYLP